MSNIAEDKTLRGIVAVGDFFEKILLKFGGLMMLGFVLTVFTDVLFRVAFTPIVWMAEVSVLLYMWAIFIGSAIAFRRGVHFTIDVLKFKNKTINNIINAIAYAVSVAFVIILLYYGWQFAMKGLKKLSLPSGIPLIYFRMCFPVSGFFMIYYCFEGIIKSIKGYNKTEEAK